MKSSLLILFILISNPTFTQSNKILWYPKPANYFEESLVLGNGKMGASVFGGVMSDMIYLNDATLWSGGPVDPYMNPDAYTHITAIREALMKEDYKLADMLQRKVQGSFSQSYAPLGTMFIENKHIGDYENYYRELNIAEAVSITRYKYKGVEFKREYFVSHPDQVMVIRLSADKKDELNFAIKFESLLKHKVSVKDDVLEISGYAPFKAEPGYRGDIKDAVVFDEESGTRFSTLMKFIQSDGIITHSDSTLEISGSSEVIILVSVATSFNGFDKDPVTEGQDNQSIAMTNLKNASQKSYDELKKSHTDDYQSYFKRLDLNLGESDAPDLPTDERLKRYAEGKEDKNLEILYFQYGRYLLISSSRTEGVPANLQGIWNPYLRPPWSSNYTLNINAPENYWLAETANLSEMHMPMLSFIENLSVTGAVTAKTFYGTGGWAACHNSDIWAMSNPVGDFGNGDPVWANWNMGGTWLSTHLWDHYLFTRDKDFLENKAYNIMKGAAQFCLEWLVPDENGNLITSPSTSPENLYITDDGYVGATLYGATADLGMIRELFENFLRASEVMKKDDEFVGKIEQALSKLHPYSISENGHLQEWYHDWKDADPKHRHQSHLYGLHPGHHINPVLTPKLADACRESLEIKGDETTGWSKGWRINLWARLWDGNRAYKMYRELLRYVEPDGMRTNYSGGGGTYPNLFDAHPPFQIDGNFGGAAAVIEMLVQSTEIEIFILPALPDAWSEGSVNGICTRNGFEISMEWKDKTLTRLNIHSDKGGKAILKYGNKQKKIRMKAGQNREFRNI